MVRKNEGINGTVDGFIRRHGDLLQRTKRCWGFPNKTGCSGLWFVLHVYELLSFLFFVQCSHADELNIGLQKPELMVTIRCWSIYMARPSEE